MDGTLLPLWDKDKAEITKEALKEFNVYWNKIKTKGKYDTLLVYNTGRDKEHVEQLIQQKVLIEPDFLISSQGSNIDYNGKCMRLWRDFLKINRFDLKTFEQKYQQITQTWNNNLWKPQLFGNSMRFNVWGTDMEDFQRAYKEIHASLTLLNYKNGRLQNEDKQGYAIWKDDDINADDAYYCGRLIEVCPKVVNFSKAPAAWFLYVCLKKRYGELLPIWGGDAENDIGMVNGTPFVGVIPANKKEVLAKAAEEKMQCVYFAPNGKDSAAGTLAGLQRWLENLEDVRTCQTKYTAGNSELIKVMKYFKT